MFEVTFVSFSVQLNSPDEDLDVSRTAAVGSRQGAEHPFFLKPPFYLKPTFVFTASFGGPGELSFTRFCPKIMLCFGF